MKIAIEWRLALAAATLLAGTGVHANEVQVSGVANFRGASYGECSAESHDVHTETAAAFAQVFTSMVSQGTWSEVITHNNKDVEGRHWTDGGKSSAGRDEQTNWGADETDVLYLHTHGGHNEAEAYVAFLMGDSAYACTVNSRDHMSWGNLGADLDIAVIKACQAGDFKVWQAGGFWRMIKAGTSNTLSMWNSFHGDSSCGSNVTSYVEDYSEDSVNDGVGENWLDEAYDSGWFGDDDCPTSIIFGPDATANANYYTYGGWRDRREGNVKNYSTIYYMSECEPSNGIELP